MLRLAELNDIPVLLSLAKEFHHTSPYMKQVFDEDRSTRFITGLIKANGEAGVIILSVNTENVPVGFLVALLTIIPWTGTRVATELAWYVSKDYRKGTRGIKLLDSFIYWAKDIAHAELAQTGSLDQSIDKIYERKGFSKYENTWIKEL